MANHFHKSEIFHSWLKMYQCGPTVHLRHYENLQQLKKSTHTSKVMTRSHEKDKKQEACYTIIHVAFNFFILC